MTSTITPLAETGTRPADVETVRGETRILPFLGGLSFLAAPVLLAAGAYTSPPQDSGSTADYIASLAEDPTLTAVSATFFHYSWVLFAFAALAGINLVRGRRGRGLAVVGGLAGAFGAIQFSGLLFNDWFLSALGNNLSSDQAVQLFEDMGDPSVGVWLMSAKVCGLLGFPVLYAGLARAGVISWWLVPLSLLPFVAMGVVPGIAGILLGLVLSLPAYTVGWRLIQRSRLSA